MEDATQARKPNAVQLDDTTGQIAACKTGFENEVVPAFPVGIVIAMDEKDTRTDRRQVRKFNIQGPVKVEVAKENGVSWVIHPYHFAHRTEVAMRVAKEGDAVSSIEFQHNVPLSNAPWRNLNLADYRVVSGQGATSISLFFISRVSYG